MRLGGLQKMTLLDFPGRVACTAFTVGCNFRCPFCHNSSLVVSPEVPELSQDDFFAFLKKRQGLLDGVAITGGEPLLHPDMPAFLRRIRSMGYAVKLDTNGAFPDRLQAILEEGLADYVAMDVKAGPDNYPRVTGLPGLDLSPIRESVSLLLQRKTDYEFRTTVVAELHTPADFQTIGPWVQGARRYFLQAFTDRDSVPFGGLHAPDRETLLAYADILRPFVEKVSLRGID